DGASPVSGSRAIAGRFAVRGAAVAGLSVAVLVRQPRDRCHLLAVRNLEEHHPLRLPPGNPDVVDRQPDQLAAVRYEHDLVGMGHREGCDHRTVAVGGLDVRDALPAAAGDAVLIGGGPLAKAVRGDAEDELLGGLQLGEALGREATLSRLAVSILDTGAAIARRTPARIGHADI